MGNGCKGYGKASSFYLPHAPFLPATQPLGQPSPNWLWTSKSLEYWAKLASISSNVFSQWHFLKGTEKKDEGISHPINHPTRVSLPVSDFPPTWPYWHWFWEEEIYFCLCVVLETDFNQIYISIYIYISPRNRNKIDTDLYRFIHSWLLLAFVYTEY